MKLTRFKGGFLEAKFDESLPLLPGTGGSSESILKKGRMW